MRLSELRDKEVRTLDGETLGRVHEVHCDKGRVVALMCGVRGFIERWTAKGGGRRVGWECVRKIERDRILVASEGALRTKRKPAASRSRQGTRRPSARRSMR
jgi:sporulation protein YlmC with PRC-barrel domain